MREKQLELIFPEEVEIWADIEGYVGLYQVSNWGRVKSFKQSTRGKILKPANNGHGYLHVVLSKDGKSKTIKVHRLVATAFIPNPYGLPQVNHKDENPLNNRAENLEWCDGAYNSKFGTRTDRISRANTNGKKSKRVFQYSITGELVKEWVSVNEVQRQMGWDERNISACCLGKIKTAYNYKWRYVRL